MRTDGLKLCAVDPACYRQNAEQEKTAGTTMVQTVLSPTNDFLIRFKAHSMGINPCLLLCVRTGTCG